MTTITVEITASGRVPVGSEEHSRFVKISAAIANLMEDITGNKIAAEYSEQHCQVCVEGYRAYERTVTT